MVPVGGSRADGRCGGSYPGECSTTGGLMRHASRRAAAEPRGRRYWVGHLAGLLLVAVVAAPLSSFAEPTEKRPDAASADPDYAAGKQALDRKDWDGAARRFVQAALRGPDNADLQNYLGHSYRQPR